MKTPKDLLLPYQRAWVDDQARFKCGCWSRQTGKDFSMASEIAADVITRERTTWMIAAPSERQSLETLAKVKEWTEAYRIAIEDEKIERENNHAQALLKSAEVLYPNGSRVIAVPGKPDTVRGMSANVALTEFAFFENAEATWRAILPSITNPLRGGLKKIRVYSTPNGKGDRFHRIVRDNYRGPGAELTSELDPDRPMNWSVHRVTIHDAVAAGLEVDIEQLKAAIDDPLGWAQEFDCEFLDGSNVLLPYDLIAFAENAEASLTCDPALFLAHSPWPLFCGIDFGRTTDPTVCVTLQRIGDTLWMRECLVLENMPTDEQEKILSVRVAAAMRSAHDYTGPGIGLGDYLVAKHGQWNPTEHEFGRVELCTFTRAFKRIIFPRLRRQFEPPTRIRVPMDVALREDLHAYQQKVQKGEFSYSAPRTEAGHSDRATALALAVHAADAPAEFAYQGLNSPRGGRPRLERTRGGILI